MSQHLELQLQITTPTNNTDSETSRKEGLGMREWITALNTAILTTRTETPDRSRDLQALMAAPEFASLVIAAQHLSSSLGLSPEDSAERLIRCFRSLDEVWTAALLKQGMKSLLD
jgi:hypothetical protein